MMVDRPSASELLHIAREIFINELLPTLPAEKRYTALMVANAMAIARRETEIGETLLREELEQFAQLYGQEATERVGETIEQRVANLNRRLLQDIRTGVFDGPAAERLRTLLLKQVCGRLRVSNPKHLHGVGLE